MSQFVRDFNNTFDRTAIRVVNHVTGLCNAVNRGFIDDASWGASSYVLGEFQPSSSLESACYYGGAGGSLLLNLFTLGTEAKFVVKGGLNLLKSASTVKTGAKALGKVGKTAKKTNDVGKCLNSGKATTKSYTLDELSKAGQAHDRAGLTKAGRALDKHGNRPGSPFPKAFGNPKSKNQQGQYHLDDILTNPKSYHTKDDVYTTVIHQDGRCAQFHLDGTFKGFMENLWHPANFQ